MAEQKQTCLVFGCKNAPAWKVVCDDPSQKSPPYVFCDQDREVWEGTPHKGMHLEPIHTPAPAKADEQPESLDLDPEWQDAEEHEQPETVEPVTQADEQPGEQTDEQTDAVAPPSPPVQAPQPEQKDIYRGISTVPLTADEMQRLTAPIEDPNTIDVRPDGLIYWPAVYYLRRLNAVIGVGQWGLQPLSDIKYDEDMHRLYRKYAFYVRGCFVREVIGEQQFYPETRSGGPGNVSKASAAEGVETDAIVRSGKRLGIGSECWDPIFSRNFLQTHCVRVPVKRGNETKYLWRKKNAPRLYGELQEAQKSEPQQSGKRLRTVPREEEV